MYKIGSLPFELSHLVDASHSGTTMFCPAFEYMSLGFTHPSVTKPIFWYSSMLWSNRVSGPPSHLSHQSRQNVIIVQGLKRAGYKVGWQ